MSNEIQSVMANLAPSKYASDAAFNDVASSGFLPRVQLMQSTSLPVQMGKLAAGTYALMKSKDNFEDLTKEVAVLVLGWRPKAIRITDKDVKVHYNNKSTEFIKVRSDSEQPNSGCLYGPEFLIWLPNQKVFATLLMGSSTARREAGQLLPLVGKGALLRSVLIRGKKHNWQGPVITEYSQGFANLPSDEELISELTKFNNPPQSATEELDEELQNRPQ